MKTTAFDLQMNPASPGMSFHKLDNAKDKNFWSVRVNADIRIIVHKTAGILLLCYVNHHDKAYDWAERRKLETHPKTGAAQLVEIRETVQQILVPQYVQEEPKKVVTAKKKLFAHLSEDELLSYGVPEEWLKDVREATEDSCLALADHLPSEAAEALLEIATGGKPRKAEPVTPTTNPFDHPDAQRRFRVMTNVEELQRALDAPWEKWTVFLHPEQKQWVARDYSGPARVAGSAGTGKTVVALHRPVHLARSHPDARVLLTTFSDTLANALRTKFRHLVWNEPRLAQDVAVPHPISTPSSPKPRLRSFHHEDERRPASDHDGFHRARLDPIHPGQMMTPTLQIPANPRQTQKTRFGDITHEINGFRAHRQESSPPELHWQSKPSEASFDDPSNQR